MSGAGRTDSRTAHRAAPNTHKRRTLTVGATGFVVRPFIFGTFKKKARVLGQKGYAALTAAVGWMSTQHAARLTSKRLRVVETVSLGEKRFAALLSVDGAEFLIGGSGSSVAMLASLDRSTGSATFGTALQQAAGERTPC